MHWWPQTLIAFGDELFTGFRKRGWLTLGKFGVLGTSLFAINVPAYNKSHFAFQSWSIGNLEYQIGKPEQ
ncbi:hypothetical protein ABF86_11880 [Nitrosomonas sp. GH22]|nr:hypothetical protein [Nitrosomonas sp. GH22]